MIKNRFLILCLLICGVLLTGCTQRRRAYVTAEGTMLGTTFRISGDVKGYTASDLYGAAAAIDRQMKASMSIFDSTSLLSRINRNRTDSADRHIEANLRLAAVVSRMSGGRYDVTVKPLVEAWGFAGKERAQHPNLDSLLKFVGYDKLRIEAGRVVKADPRMQLDFNSIAKGYTVDLLADTLESMGAANYLVDIGGEVRCRGVNPSGEGWRIGVETPFDGNMTDGEFLQCRIRLTEGGMATSGNYRRFFIDDDGRKVAHTIDPLTGRSAVSRLLSATVVADSCALADALGTMFMALGSDEAMAMSAAHPDLKVYFILSGRDSNTYETYASPAMERLLIKN